MMDDELVRAAVAAKRNAYAPYSSFPVGAAVVFDDGRVHDGANVENASFGATMCAERVAIFKAVTANPANRVLSAVAVAADTARPIPPCGMCLQVIAQFVPEGGDCRIVMVGGDGGVEVSSLRALLPRAFAGDFRPGG